MDASKKKEIKKIKIFLKIEKNFVPPFGRIFVQTNLLVTYMRLYKWFTFWAAAPIGDEVP